MPKYYLTTTSTLNTSKTSIPAPADKSFWSASFSATPESRQPGRAEIPDSASKSTRKVPTSRKAAR